MEWIIANWTSVVAIITGIISTASIVAKMTPTEVDDKWVARGLKLVDFLAVNNKPTEQR